MILPTTLPDPLIRPLADDAPCGADMSFSPEFDTIQLLRREDDPSLDQGEWVTELKRADWPGVVRSCTELLSTQAKDLRVAGWLAEALAQTKAYGGLADGLATYAGLCESHWDGVHPLADAGDLELRIGSLRWLLGQVVALSDSRPVLKHGHGSCTLRDVAAARLLHQAVQRNAAGVSTEGKLTMDDIARARRDTPAVDLQASLRDSRRCQDALARLQAVADARLGDESPSFVPARQALEAAVAGIERLAQESGLLSPAEPDTLADDGTTPIDTPAIAAGPPGSRQQALAQLRQVADFFRRTEPHSPVAYLADKAARWGDMPLHVWLRAVMKEQGSLAQMEELLGVEAPPSADTAE